MTPAELEPLYALHRVVWLEAARRAGARQDAEDVVHDACEAVLSGALPLAGESNADMVERLVVTLARRYRRREDRHDAIARRAAELPPHDQLTHIEQRVAVQRAVDHLKESHHLDPTVVWATVQGHTVPELAQTIGLSYQPTWLRVQRAWVLLRTLLVEWREARKHWGKAAKSCGESECRPQ